MNIDDIINRQSYPLHDPMARVTIVAESRAALRRDGACVLRDFVLPGALADMREEAKGRLTEAYRRDIMMGINPKDGLELAESVVNRKSPYRMRTLGSDWLAPEGALQRLYQSAEVLDLLSSIVEVPQLHCTADPLINVTVTYMGDGDQQGWHFDDNDFVVSLLLQRPDEGGEFEYVPDATQLTPAEVTDIVDERSPRLRRLSAEAGALVLFRGRHALHRVAPVVGDKLRIIALLSYDAHPGFVFSDEVRLKGLGRIDSSGVTPA